MNPFADLDAKVKKHQETKARVKAFVKEHGGAYVRMNQFGIWRCRMRIRKGDYEKLQTGTADALVELVKAWAVKHDRVLVKTEAPKP